jgi:hypothetical protein
MRMSLEKRERREIEVRRGWGGGGRRTGRKKKKMVG